MTKYLLHIVIAHVIMWAFLLGFFWFDLFGV